MPAHDFDLSACKTLPALFFHACHLWGKREALREYVKTQSLWAGSTYEETAAEVERWRKAYSALGLVKGDRVALLMPSCKHYVHADMAALANGLVPVPLHAVDTPAASHFILQDSTAKALVTHRYARWQQIEANGDTSATLRHVIFVDDDIPAESDTRARTLSTFLAAGDASTSTPHDDPTPADTAALVYTSGTTGRPKGVILTHANIVANVLATLKCVSPKPGDVFLSFLPLSHTFERTAGYYLALATGCTIAYSRSVLMLAEDLKTVCPDVIISVPRIYEKIYARLNDKLKRSSAAARCLFNAAVATGWRDFCRKNAIVNNEPSRWYDGLVRAWVLPKVRASLAEQFGGRLRIAISGGAALNHDIARIFCGLGLPIIQGYGMTETSPIVAGNNLEHNNPDTVGRLFDGMQLRLSSEGEIQLKGPSVMRGYWRQPDATAAVFTEDGWLKTGDVGELTPEGLLRIRGRIKEIIVTSTGEKICPVDVESAIETDPLFEQAFLVGENLPFMSLMVVLADAEWKALAASLGLDPEDPVSLEDARAKSAALKRAKEAARHCPHYALPRAVVLSREPWTIDNGLLTPTLKLKRRPLLAHFDKRLQRIYARARQ